ncbi:E3 ubiquitin-protein ligase TRIM7-like [Rhineura floridana]|uniref:E3 ubiquitin-protein ligase TRIM7-like n=1 Tax=Rhineura floridana TaxID=261503 RepID=UPI002AC885C6|nr:E3 ubiquitin-protein ligase TRIM7-like [Rhineura floridana]
MEDEEGYMRIQAGSRETYTQPAPPKAQESSSKCWKITLGGLLAGSIALNVGLTAFLLVFQRRVQDGSSPLPLANSCDWVPGSSTASVTLDPKTAHRRLVLSRDRKSVSWGQEEQNIPNNTERFDKRVWVLGQDGFTTGKHCWEVEVKGKGEWAVGVAKESVKRKGLPDFSTTEGIWGIGEYWGAGNYLAFTSPQHTRLQLDKRPQRIRVFLDYIAQQVDFFNPETKVSLYTFNSAAFSGERVYPWFRVWNGTELVLHP